MGHWDLRWKQLDAAQQLDLCHPGVGRLGEELPVAVVGRGGPVAEGGEGVTWPSETL